MTDTAFSVQAQQRYRERRKQKFSEMEESLHALASQVEQLNSVQSQNSMLQVAATLTSHIKAQKACHGLYVPCLQISQQMPLR